MSHENVIHIWPPDTGIMDLVPNWKELQSSDVEAMKGIWGEQRDRLSGTKQLSEFTERLSREWAIETGIVENVYEIDAGVTQTLIERGFQAELLTHGSINKPREYVLQILHDQKNALDGIFDFVASKRELSTSYIKELHSALLRSQTHTEAIDSQGHYIEVPLLRGEWKELPNSPTRDGKVYAYCPPEHVSSEMDRLIALNSEHLKKGVPIDVQAAWLHHRFSQIHPFQDGNGRVARALSSMILVRAGMFPLVVTRDNKVEYLDTLGAADQGDLKPLIHLIAKLQRKQFMKATALSEIVLSTHDGVQQVLDGLLKSAEKRQEEKKQELKRVFETARKLEDDVYNRLQNLSPDITTALQRVTPSSEVRVERSDEITSHYFRAQIIENAKYHLNYFADTSDYRSWVNLNMRWQRRAKIVFTFHGIGRPFSGSLVCAPFMEFRDFDTDADNEGEQRSTFVPIAEEPFVFFYNQALSDTLAQFHPWRESVLKVALKELGDNL